jgi:hypothetical protein
MMWLHKSVLTYNDIAGLTENLKCEEHGDWQYTVSWQYEIQIICQAFLMSSVYFSLVTVGNYV